MTLFLLAVVLVLLNAKMSLEASEDPIVGVIRDTVGCKNLKDCEVPKIKALALDKFPKNLKKEVEVSVKIVVVLEQQTNKTDKKIGENLMNAIMIALDACSRSQMAYTSSYNRALSAKSKTLKMIKGVEEVALSEDKSMSCVVMSTLKKYTRDHCQICQRMIPDFMDGLTAEKMANNLVKSLTDKAPAHIKDYSESIKTFAANAAAYMDKLVVCVKGGKKVDGCRNIEEEATLCSRMGTMFNLGKQVIGFMATIGTTITTEIQGFIGRVTTTHKAYKQCLQSGAAASVNISSSVVDPSIIDKYEEKVKTQIKPLKDVATRALQTKLRMLRERKLQRSLRGSRSQQRR
uniref:Periplasmic beta-glucosidase n=1 Tax=Lygus hesperus TaxID=30085 RepID=A0A0A9WNT1_LYGHE